jgi:hypothetical protein
MDSSLTTGLVAVFASAVGSSASIAAAWVTQHYQKIRERARAELRRRELLYGEFITEAARLTSSACDHSLERRETLGKLYALLGRIHLVASDPVHHAAKECCRYVVELYSKPNLSIDEIYEQLRASDHPLAAFAVACHMELDQYVRQ